MDLEGNYVDIGSVKDCRKLRVTIMNNLRNGQQILHDSSTLIK